ncbi:MAG: protein kinase domain-containing protein [Terrisporobacter sp.]|uniref:protein kinase domain-containing protein n=1 Tax=Terrisporobacter sp. TaxID=1965305 RepID=UPI0025FA780B|nr:hypothetical protein [uncultured Terrisporobacter sp.]
MKNFNEKYTVRDFIDKNKWSNVYECINNETNEKIILNIITSLDKSEEHMSYFKEEINTLMSMNNSNLISINDMSSYINKDKTYYYIESEYFEGLNLKELKESIYLDKVKSLEIIREVIKGIKEFNDREINYGILKEENIIINKDGIVKLDTLSFINRYEGYLNCEEIKNRGFDYYEDIYMIGKILCKLITGKSTFNLKENNEELDVDLIEILMKSTNIKHVTKHKYKDLDEFLGEVTSYIEHGDINYKNIVNLEKINYHKLNFKAKYIGAIFCAIVIISGIAMGSKYILNNTNKNNKVTAQASENTKDNYKKDTDNQEDVIYKDDRYNLIQSNTTSKNTNKENTHTNKDETQSQNNTEKEEVINKENTNKENNYNTNKEDPNKQEYNNKEENKEDNKNQEDNKDQDNNNNQEEDNKDQEENPSEEPEEGPDKKDPNNENKNFDENQEENKTNKDNKQNNNNKDNKNETDNIKNEVDEELDNQNIDDM